MAEVEGAGVALRYDERGAGPAVLAIHAMASDGEDYSDVRDALAAAGRRAIAYDRRGYGGSGAPEPYAATTIQEQAEDAAALLEAVGAAPATLIGDGFGALIALDLLVRRPALVRAAVLVDPALFAYVPAANEVLAAERASLEEALRAGGPRAAVAAWLDGHGTGGDRARAQAAHAGFFADYAGQASWAPARRELRAIGVAVAVVTRDDAPAHVVAAADALAALVPGALRVVGGDVVAVTLELGGS